MSRRGVMLGGAVTLVGVVAGVLGFRAAGDPYVVHLQSRISALLPALERELGEPVPRPIRVAVATREQLARLVSAEKEEILRAIEGDPQGGTDPEAGNPFTAEVHFVFVDGSGTLHVCREELEGALHAEGPWDLLEKHIGARAELAPRVQDEVIALGLVHAFQVRTLGRREYLRGARDRSGLLARRVAVEGHAASVVARAMAEGEEVPPVAPAWESSALPALKDSYSQFDMHIVTDLRLYPLLQGRVFVESAMGRLGRVEAMRRLFAEPPSLLQTAHPETWPGTPGPDAGTDRALLRARPRLAAEWKWVDGGPVPTPVFLTLLGPASPAAREAAAGALLEAQRIEATGGVLRHAVRGHLLAARDEAGARLLHDAWVEAARIRDTMVPENPGLRRTSVLDSTWSEAELDGAPVLLATRRYHSMGHLLEHSIVLRRGRFVLELRLVEDPGGLPAVLRTARRMLACLGDGPDGGDPRSPSWEARWLFASHPDSGEEGLLPLLEDTDADVRASAVRNLLRRSALTDLERSRVAADPDPLVRLTALTARAPGEAPEATELRAAIEDGDPWVAAGGWQVAQEQFAWEAVDPGLITAALGRPEPTVRRAASRLIDEQSCPDPVVLLALVRIALPDGDPGVRGHGAAPLLHVPSGIPGLSEIYVGLLTGPDERLRTGALINLSIREGVPGTAAALLPFLEDEEDADLAIEALGKLGAEARAAVPDLRRRAEEARASGQVADRLRALVALAGITGDRAEAVDAVRGYLATGTDTEARQAVAVLEDLGAAAGLVPELAKRLASKDRSLVLSILHVLEDLGAAVEPALPGIRSLCESDDPGIRAKAVGTMESIRKWMEGMAGE